MPYATRDDVFNLGFSAAAFVSRPRAVVVDDIDIATGRIKLKGHGLSSLDVILIEQVARGSMPIDITNVTLSRFVYYSTLPLGNDIFQVVNPTTGLPFTFFDVGSGWGIAIDPLRRLDMHLADTAEQIDECLTAEAPPIKVDTVTGLYPWQLRGMNARMAALAASTSLAFDNPEVRKTFDRIEAQREADAATRADWKAGKPLNPRPLDQDAVPNNGTRAGYSSAGSHWTTGCLG